MSEKETNHGILVKLFEEEEVSTIEHEKIIRPLRLLYPLQRTRFLSRQGAILHSSNKHEVDIGAYIWPRGPYTSCLFFTLPFFIIL